MSQQELSLGILPPAALVEAVGGPVSVSSLVNWLNQAAALANPPDLFRSWTPGFHRQRLSEFCVVEWESPDGPPNEGETGFVIDAEPQIFGTGAAVGIRYVRNRNANLFECAENIALDNGSDGLDDDTIELIIRCVQPKQGLRTIVEFRTLPDGSPHMEASIGPFYPDALVLPNPAPPLPSVLLSSLRYTHRLARTPHVFLVKTTSDPLSDDVRVLKLCNGGSRLLKELEFMARLPEVDFLLRPTHTVLDEDGLFYGLLSNQHPASSLWVTMDKLHPDAERLVLPPSGVDQSSGSLAGIPTSVTWRVKLAWATDVAAAVAWLHAKAIFWGDLKTDNILLCTDGHCRLIDYCPGGWTELWCPPEAQRLDWEGTAEGDVFALGLVLWCVAVEVASFEREQEYVSPRLSWSEGIPNWFQSLVASCLEHEPGRRPSAHCVYETLRHRYTFCESHIGS